MTRVIAILSILALAARDSGRHPRVPARFRAFFIASPFIFRSLNSYPPATSRQSRIIPHGSIPSALTFPEPGSTRARPLGESGESLPNESVQSLQDDCGHCTVVASAAPGQKYVTEGDGRDPNEVAGGPG